MTYDIEQEPIVLSKPLFDLLLKQEKAGDLIALYTFYYYTAKWQKTDKIRATVGYVAKGLDWGVDRVRRSRVVLKNLGLIEDIQRTTKEGGKFARRYVKVHFIWAKETIKNRTPENASTEKGYHGKSDTNALSNSNRNALRDSSKIQEENLGIIQTINKLNLPKHLAIEKFPKKFQDSKTFQEYWIKWIKYRKTEKKNAIGKISFSEMLNKIKKWGVEGTIEALRHSIECGYIGLFEPNDRKQNKKLDNAFHGDDDIPSYDEGTIVIEV